MAKKTTAKPGPSAHFRGKPKFYAYLRQGTVAPFIREEKWTEDPWVWHGRENGFEGYIRSLVDNCAPAERSITMLAQFLAGKGLRFYGPPDENGKQGEEIQAAQKLFQEWMQDESEEDFLWKCFYDAAHGLGLSFNVRRSAKAIVRLDHLDRFGLRSGKLVKGRVNEYWWSSDWARHRETPSDDRFKPTRFEAFDPAKTQGLSTIFRKAYRPMEPYYGGLFWMGAIQAAETWTKVDNYNRSQIDTGFSPAAFLAWQFEGTETEMDEEDKAIEEAYTGSMSRGIFSVPYGVGEEKPKLTILPRGNHAGELDNMRTGCADVIYDAFGIPSILLRDRSEGLTSQGEAIAQRIQQFQRTVVAPFQKFLTQPLQQLMALSGINVYECKIIPLDIFDPVQSEAIIMASTKVDEAREQRGEEPIGGDDGETILAKVKGEKAVDPNADPGATPLKKIAP